MFVRRSVVVGVLALTACSAFRGSPPRGGFDQARVITAEEIERSGATDAFDALRRSGTPLSISERRGAQGERVAHRGRSSMFATEAPMVVLDGVMLADFLTLRSIPAVAIHSIRILGGIEGTRYHGTGATNGVIEITTRKGPAS